jgi:hypothetical protein
MLGQMKRATETRIDIYLVDKTLQDNINRLGFILVVHSGVVLGRI